ncbi:hypothetical protein [Billgrantia gudaonensis]|uniref:Uncharacterized protein n=1 Tax=Billgrantia gudaonensis TaxID=376427 RepID=A0A1G9E2Y2_9GAMM|nr:hypothetical protein [Halomonas gudaonensis]SDK70458.1 hypothetical protein SAMN04487954_12410 [Halomonas gudaonensis]
MSAQVHPLPTPHRQPPAVEPDRGEWGALRAELHGRCADRDLAALWAELAPGERRTLLASAKLDTRDARLPIERMPQFSRNAIRAAIHRMSQYANRLRAELEGHKPHPSRELAGHARQALAEGNTEAALHWLAIIERGVA